MAATGYTPIQLYRTATSGAAPVSANLANGELAINYNTADMALYAKNSGGVVKLLMNNPAGLKYPTSDGTAGQIVKTDGAGNLSFASLSTLGVSTISFGSTGLTPATATSGAVTVAGTLAVANGGTGDTTAAGARTNLSAASSGANSDITSLTGLTTALSVAQGGTGQTTYTDGQLLIGNSTGNTLTKATLTQGTGITITNSAGSITIAASGTAGVTSFSAGSTGLTPNTATTGAVSLAGTLGAGYGGTGQASYTTGDLLYASGSTALSKLADVATGNSLISGGVGVAPSWGKIGLTTHISGTLGATNGGTGQSSYTVGDLLYASTTTALSKLAGVATGNALISGGVGVAFSWGKIGLTTHVSGTLPVANGGTGITSVGTSGNVLTSNGTAWVSSAPVASLPSLAVFTASSTWTVPAGITRAKVTVISGGGAGGFTVAGYSSGGGGGGGTSIKYVSGLTPGGTVSVTVGAGGTTGSGGTSSFGAYCSATGGAVGTGLVGGNGGIGSSGDFNFAGGGGGAPIISTVDGFLLGGTGGSSFFGGGAAGTLFGTSGGVGLTGRAYGGGGGGSAAGSAGGVGADGIVIVEY
jgi:hypothetical protein